jgi:tetratricopeptide (TPR) repeat protein
MKRGREWEGFSQTEKRSRLTPGVWSTAGHSTIRLLAIAVVLFQVALCLADAQQTASSRSLARSYFASAQKSLAAGDSIAALEKLNRAVQADPNFAQAYLLLGLTEFQGGETAKSIQHYKRALKLQPRSYTGHYNLALAYLRERNFQDARAELEQAVSLDARQADAAYDLGIVLLELGDASAALTHLRHARALKPRPDVDFNIVRAEIEAGRVSEARADAEAAAKVLGADFQWNAAVGQLFLKNSQPKEAAVYLDKAFFIRPNDAEVRRQLAAAYLQSNQPEQVLSTVREAKTAEDHYLRASAYYLSHRFPEADQESEQALTLAQDNPQILALRTRLLQRAGQQDAALEMAKKAAALAPNWDEPYYLAGVSYYFTRHYDESAGSLARAVELNPNSARALFLEAIALANLGKTGDAERCFRLAIALQPNNARLHCHLGILLARQNEPGDAEASFRKAIQLKPDYALSHYEFGKLLASTKEFKQAAEELSQAVDHDPSLGAAYYQLARVYARLGEKEKSERALATFGKLYQRQTSESEAVDQAVEQDTRKETE